MTLEEFIDMAAGWPLDAVELTGYYFPQTTPRYLAGLKGRCTRLGLDISGTAVGNDFCTTNASRLKEQIDRTIGTGQLSLVGGGVPRMDAIKQVARRRGLSKREVYDLVLKERE